MDDGPGEIAGVQRIADAQALRRGDELVGEGVEERFGDEDAAGRDAALAAGLEAADEGAVDGQVQPGVGADDDGAFAAHLAGHDAIVMLGRQLLNALAHVVAAGEQHHVDVRHRGPALRRPRPSPWTRLTRPAGKPASSNNSIEALADGRRVLRRLEDGGVAFEQAGTEHPQRHGEGEVPRRDDGDDAPRLAAHEGVLLGDLRGQHFADRHAAGAEDVLDHVQAFDDLGPALADDLAALAGHQPGEIVGLALDDLGEVVEQLGAADAAGAPPGRKGGAGGGDRLPRLVGAAGRENAEDLALAGRAVALETVAVGRLPAAGDEVSSGDGDGHDGYPPVPGL